MHFSAMATTMCGYVFYAKWYPPAIQQPPESPNVYLSLPRETGGCKSSIIIALVAEFRDSSVQ